MIWQDAVLSIGGWILNISAIPILLDKTASIPRLTSGTQTAVLLLFIFTYLSLGLSWAAGSVAVGAAIWLLIFLIRNPETTTNE